MLESNRMKPLLHIPHEFVLKSGSRDPAVGLNLQCLDATLVRGRHSWVVIHEFLHASELGILHIEFVTKHQAEKWQAERERVCL